MFTKLRLSVYTPTSEPSVQLLEFPVELPEPPISCSSPAEGYPWTVFPEPGGLVVADTLPQMHLFPPSKLGAHL